MCRLGVEFILLFALAGGAKAQSASGGPIEPKLPHAPGDTLIVFERLASAEGLPQGALSYRIHRCLPDGSFVQAPAIVPVMPVDPVDAGDSAANELGKFVQAEDPFRGVQFRDPYAKQLCPADYFRVKKSCYSPAFDLWACLAAGRVKQAVLYDLRSGAVSLHRAWCPSQVIPDDTGPLIHWLYHDHRNRIGFSVYQLDSLESKVHLAGGRYEPVSEFFRPLREQQPVILGFDCNGADRKIQRRKQDLPLRLLRLDRGGPSLQVLATLPDCRVVLDIAVDALGGILLAGQDEVALRLYRIDAGHDFAVSWTDKLPAKGRFPDWYMSNISDGRVLVASQHRGPERSEKADVRLLDSETLQPVWTGWLQAPNDMDLSSVRLAGKRVLITWGSLHGQAAANDYHVRYAFYTIEGNAPRLRLVPDAASQEPLEFIAHPTFGRSSDLRQGLLAAVEGRGFLCWRGDSLTWLQ